MVAFDWKPMSEAMEWMESSGLRVGREGEEALGMENTFHISG